MAIPANVRIGVPIAFPAQVLGSGLAVVTKSNGVYTFSVSVDGLTDQIPAPASLATDFVPVYDSVLKAWFKTSLAGFPGISYGAGVAAWLAVPSSANLAAAVTGKTGAGALVFNNTPTLVTPVLGAAIGTTIVLGGGSLGSNGEQMTINGNVAGQIALRAGNAHASGFSTIWVGPTNEGLIRFGSSVGNKVTVVASVVGVPVTLATNATDRLIASDTNVAHTVPVGLPTFTVAALPAGSAGWMAFATNCRVFNGAGTLEGAGVGTGGVVSHNGTAWKVIGTNITASA